MLYCILNNFRFREAIFLRSHRELVVMVYLSLLFSVVNIESIVVLEMGHLAHLLLFAQKLKGCGFFFCSNHRKVFFECICECGILMQVSTTCYFLTCFKLED